MSYFRYTHTDDTQTAHRLSDDWQNFGDASPLRHGGMWVRYDMHGWETISNTHPGDLPDDMVDDEHLVELGWVDRSEIWVDGDPQAGPTDLTERFISESGRYDSVEQLYTDGSVDWLIPQFVWYRGTDHHEYVPHEELPAWLESRGIEL